MKSKRAFFLGALVALMILPVMGIAESWAGFVKTVNAATKKAKGEVVVAAPDTVEGNEKGDPAIYVPKGAKLVIEGGSFEVMMLGGGDITLRGVNVQNPQNSRMAAIFIVSNGNKAVDLALTIEEDTVIASETGSGIFWSFDYTKSPDIKLLIDNRGTISAGRENERIGIKARGVEIVHRITKSKKADITVRNSGAISGAIGIDVSIVNQGLSTASVVNEGKIDAVAGGIVASVQSLNKKSSVTVENAGEVAASAESGSGIALGVGSRIFQKKPAGRGQVINEGTVTGGQAGISVGTDYDPMLPIKLSGGGTARAESGPDENARDIDIGLSLESWAGAPDQAGFEQAVGPWLEENFAMDDLPEGTRVRVQLSAFSGEAPGPIAVEWVK